MTFLTDPGQLDADDVGVGVRPEVRREAGVLDAPGHALRRRHATTVAAGWRCDDLAGQVRPGHDRDPVAPATGHTRATTSLMRRPVPSSMPFIRLTSTRVGRHSAAPSRQVLAQRLRRHGQHDELGAGQRRRRRRRWRDSVAGSSMPGW